MKYLKSSNAELSEPINLKYVIRITKSNYKGKFYIMFGLSHGGFHRWRYTKEEARDKDFLVFDLITHDISTGTI